MAKRAGWDSLSPGYKKRIIAAGMTRDDYEAGGSLAKSRGHSKTPERPHSYDPKKFPQYANKRTTLEAAFLRKKEQIWGDRPRWDPNKSRMHMQQKPPTLKQLQWAINADEQDLLDAILEDPKTYHWVGYK